MGRASAKTLKARLLERFSGEFEGWGDCGAGECESTQPLRDKTIFKISA